MTIWKNVDGVPSQCHVPIVLLPVSVTLHFASPRISLPFRTFCFMEQLISVWVWAFKESFVRSWTTFAVPFHP